MRYAVEWAIVVLEQNVPVPYLSSNTDSLIDEFYTTWEETYNVNLLQNNQHFFNKATVVVSTIGEMIHRALRCFDLTDLNFFYGLSYLHYDSITGVLILEYIDILRTTEYVRQGNR